MFGHKWVRATARVVEARSGIPAGAGQPAGWEIVVDVNKPVQGRTRFTVHAPATLPALAAGTPVAVEVEAKTGQVRLAASTALSALREMATSIQAAVQDGGITVNVPENMNIPPAATPGAGASPMQQALHGQFASGGANLGSGIGDPGAPAAASPPTFGSSAGPGFPAPRTGLASSTSRSAQNDMRIARLTALRDQGLITNAEFEAQSRQAHEEF